MLYTYILNQSDTLLIYYNLQIQGIGELLNAFS